MSLVVEIRALIENLKLGKLMKIKVDYLLTEKTEKKLLLNQIIVDLKVSKKKKVRLWRRVSLKLRKIKKCDV